MDERVSFVDSDFLAAGTEGHAARWRSGATADTETFDVLALHRARCEGVVVRHVGCENSLTVG